MGRGRVEAVLRRKFDNTFSWVVSVAALAVTAYVLLNPFPGNGFGEQAEFVAIMAPLIWFMWMVGAHAVVKVHESGVLVVNWFRAYWVPWASLATVEATREVTLVTTDGERINVVVGALSAASSLRGNRLQAEIREEIEKHRPAAPSGGGGVRKWVDLAPWHFLAVVTFLLMIGLVGLWL
ncbi:PH domain-containing protein [Lentzea sp. NBRC 102530]|uniref:PH domain-containing protein n=1 Tax=Lentzea sp. NBRC 102530 TaxID=3032201 RepID=UPI00255390AD|nr:PH domain-containing protein [Lentzea sp. NBRC 102530]